MTISEKNQTTVEKPQVSTKISKIAWFSGTGSTKYVAEELAKLLVQRGSEAPQLYEIKSTSEPIEGFSATEQLIILFPVHAFGAPEVVHQWLDKLPEGKQTQTIVLSVSGGGEIWPNTCCRNEVIEKLERKAYKVIYERMFVMPCNMVFESDSDFLGRIMQILPLKLEDMLSDLEMGVVRRSPYRVSRVFLNPISALERKGSKKGAKYFQVENQCTGCGVCIKGCPTENIEADDQGRPVFKENCLICLKCVYSCPVQAIKMPKYQKWLVSAYDMEVFKEYLKHEPVKSIDECCKGLVWLGVKRYLKDIKY